MNLRLVTLALALLPASLLRAQTPPSAPPLCQPADVDATFYFADAPPGHQVIAINLRNATPQACTLRRELAPSFAVDGHSMNVPTCFFCTPDGRYDFAALQRNDQFLLAAGASAHVTYRWSSTSDGSAADTCQKVDWGDFFEEWGAHGSLLFDSGHWKPHVCSTLQISGYEPGPMLESVPPPASHASLQVSIPPTPVYADEFEPVTLQLHSPNSTVVPTGHCPELYAIINDSPGSTRFQAIFPDDYSTLVLNTTHQPTMSAYGYPDDLPAQFKGYTRLCEIKGKSTTTVVTLPASMQARLHILPSVTLSNIRHLVWRAVDKATGQPVFIAADPHFTVLDPSTLAPNWGPQAQGIGAGLSVDKNSFTFGETIPIHIHWENFAATQPLAVGECGNPEPSVELQDASHHVLHTFESGSIYDCMGHGWGPFAVKAGEPHHDFLSLVYGKSGYTVSGFGEQIPLRDPGVYYLVSAWSPSILVERKSGKPPIMGSGATFGGKYATTRSLPVRIEILPAHSGAGQ